MKGRLFRRILRSSRRERFPEAKVTICEGRYHQVKRMFEAIGCKVIYLKRLSMGSLTLDPALEKGAFRKLTEEEIAALLQPPRKEKE